MNNIKFWQPPSSRTETPAFKDLQIEGTNTRASSVSGNAIFTRLHGWDETLQALDIVQSVDMTAPDDVDLATQSVEGGIDIEQLNFLQVRRQPAEFKYSSELALLCGYGGQEEPLDSINFRSRGSQDK
jgi:hypothetical protein